MPCSAQKVETAPRGASSDHCEIARRTRGSMGSWAATAAASRPKCHHQVHQNCHRCPDAELSPMSCDMTTEATPHCDRGCGGWNDRESQTPTRKDVLMTEPRRGGDGDLVPLGLRASAAWTWRIVVVAGGI